MDDTQRVSGAHRERPALARCIGVTPEEFGAWYWGRRPLLCRSGDLGRRAGKSYDDLITVADVDDLVSRRGLRTPFLRMAHDGDVLPPQRYAGPGGAGAQIADQALDERVLACFAEGATLVLQGLHRLWPPLGDFARQLTDDLGHPTGVNAYLTPPASRGFAPHYDTHDVFVLQIAGTKHWRVHAPVLTDPLAAQRWDARTEEVSATADGPPELDLVLEPGDAMYLPRGWVHSAESLHELSMHLTIGVFPVTRYALLEAMLGIAAEEPELRRSLPFGVDASDPAQIAEELDTTTRLAARWLFEADPGRVAERVRPQLWSQTRPAPIRPLAQAAALRTVDPATLIAVRTGLRWRLTSYQPERVILRTFDRTVEFPAYCAEAIRTVLEGDPVRVADLPGLDPTDQVVLARRLLREAVVVPVDP